MLSQDAHPTPPLSFFLPSRQRFAYTVHSLLLAARRHHGHYSEYFRTSEEGRAHRAVDGLNSCHL